MEYLRKGSAQAARVSSTNVRLQRQTPNVQSAGVRWFVSENVCGDGAGLLVQAAARNQAGSNQ